MSLFVVQFGLQTDQLPGFVGALVSLTALLLPFLLVVVQAVAMALAVQLNVFVLGLRKKNKREINFQFILIRKYNKTHICCRASSYSKMSSLTTYI